MKYLTYLILPATIVGGILWYYLDQEGSSEYTRSECVVRLNLVGLKGLEGDTRSAEEDRFFNSLNPIAMGGRDLWPIGSLGFGAEDRSEYYLVFWKDCDQRLEFTREMIERYRASTDRPLELEIDPSPVSLDVRKTLCFGGEHWIDGDEPC